jgi:hypothetical protein
MIIKQLSVFLENKSGRLTEVTEILGQAGINISALSIADTSEYGILRMVVSNPDLAHLKLKENNFSVSLTDVACLSTPNEPGSLAKALKILSQEKISIEYMYAFSMGEKAFVVIRTENIQRCIDTLQAHKMELLKANELYRFD